MLSVLAVAFGMAALAIGLGSKGHLNLNPTVPVSSEAAPGPFATPPPSSLLPPPSLIIAKSRAADRPIPTSISIPAIAVDSALVKLGLNPDGSLAVPTDYAKAGWWAGGTVPGDPGPAVVVGHVDSVNGPAIFYRLRSLRPGDLVQVRRSDHVRVTFVVERVQQIAKDTFPTQEVYAELPYPALRLVTCGGAFDTTTGHYVDNVIVFATIASG